MREHEGANLQSVLNYMRQHQSNPTANALDW